MNVTGTDLRPMSFYHLLGHSACVVVQIYYSVSPVSFKT